MACGNGYPTRRDAVRILVAAGTGAGLRSLLPAEDRFAMLNRAIPSTGEPIPVIGLGTYRAFDAGPSAADRAPLEAVLRELVAGGGRVVDSSPMYGRAESVVGALTARLGIRKRLFLTTKVWTEGREAGIRQMEESIAKMNAGVLDLMQVHNMVDWRTHLSALAGWKTEGRVRYVGVTHYRTDAFDDLAAIVEHAEIDFVQLNYSIATRDAERRLLPLAADRRVAVIVNRPFEAGALFAAVRGRPLPDWARELGCASWAQIFLKFVVSHPAVTCAIPATDKVAHLRDNLAAGRGPMPGARLRARMAAVLS